MVDFVKTLQKPFSDINKFIIGVVLSIIPIVNATIVQGYAIECSGLGKNKSGKLPEWKELGDLFVKGLLAVIIGLVYMLPASVFFMVGMRGLITGFMKEGWSAIFSYLPAAVPMFIIGAILWSIAAYLTPMAVLNYIKNRSLSKAFAFNEVFHKCFNTKYLVAFIVVCVVLVIATTVLFLIPFIGLAIANFVVTVFAYTVFGEVYKEVK